MNRNLMLALTITGDGNELPWDVADRVASAAFRILSGHGMVIAECVESLGPFEESPERYHFYGNEMALKLFYGLMKREQPSCGGGMTFEEIVGLESPSVSLADFLAGVVPGECF